MSAIGKLLRHNGPGGTRRRGRLRRSAPIWLGLVVTVGSAIPPATGEVIPWLPTFPEISIANAGYPCSSHSGEFPMFTGKLSDSSGTTLTESTTGNVYGRVTNVDERWQPSPGCGYYRYDAVIWATDNSTTNLTVHWGALSGDAQPCNYVVGTNDYIHANAGACPSASTAKHIAQIGHEATYQNDVDLDDDGDFAFAHSDCIDWYTKDKKIQSVTTAVTSGEPGANCGYKQLDGTGTTQTLVVDGTAPTVSFVWPPAGGPIVIPSAFAAVTFNATDAVAGFFGPDDWDLTRKIATWNGSVCLTFGPDTGAKAVVSGTFNGQSVSSQGLQLGKCYQWTLTARDQNGNVAATITSGSIRTDTTAVLGDQPQFGIESWDLGAGDSLSVSTGSGNLRLTHPIVNLPIIGGTLALAASYNSHDAADIGLGTGWRLNVQRRLTINGDGTVTFTDADGSRHTFTNPTGSPTVTYTRPATLYAALVRDTAATPDRFTLTYRDQSKDVFDEDIASTGLLKQVKDRHGNTTSIAYTTGTAKITTITDPSNRTISFSWTGSYLTQIVDWANVSGGIVQTSGSGNRTHRFFYSGTSLIGWADPLNTSGSCPTAASHRTCLTYTGGFLSAIAKTQTYETFSAGTLSSATRTVTTSVSYEFADAIGVTDAEAGATTLSHPLAGGTTVVRPGTPASETTYELVSPTDTNGRIDSVKHKLGGGQVETETTYNATYPIEPATIKQNKGGGALEHVTNYTYQASSLGLLSRLDEPLDGTNRRYTDLTYNANNDVTRQVVYQASAPTNDTETRYCYTNSGCSTSATDLLLRSIIENYVDGAAGGTNGHVEDVTTTFLYDTACAGGTTCGQRTRSTRSNYSGSTLLDSAATGWIYDANGNMTAEIRNWVSGTVTDPGDDITPNGTTNARTDLTTAYAYDTAGNRASSADPRRAIENAIGTSLAPDDFITRALFDALGRPVTMRMPTTPGQLDCGSPPSCREATTIYDELGLVRETADINDLVIANKYDKAGRLLESYQDPAASAGFVIGIATYDSQGRLLTAKDQRQATSGSLGYADYDYDELGRVTDRTQAAGSTPDVATITHRTYDNLGRKTSEETGYGTGTSQVTIWTYDIGGRTTKVDDEFTCATTSFDYRDLAVLTKEGLPTGSCSGTAQREITNTYDARGRLAISEITAGEGDNDVLQASTYDGAGRELSISSTRASSTTSSAYSYNQLDQPISEVRSDGGTAISWTKTNADPAGNATDHCVWNSNPGTELCKAVGQTFTTPPAVHTSAGDDARDERISLDIPGKGSTTYDAAHDYQVDVIYVPAKVDSGNWPTAEHRSDHQYDSRHRTTSIAQSVCPVDPEAADPHACTAANASTATSTYEYDDNGNRSRASEANGAATVDRYYCYDGLNQLVATRSTSGCVTGLIESYTYDDAGNRTAAGATTFSYDAQGQLSSCNPTCGTVAYDDSGRTSQWNAWYLSYDGDGRLATACKVAGCATGDMVTMRYDANGRRVEIVTRPSGGSITVKTFRYQGDAVAQEFSGSGTPVLTRTFVTDEAGAVVKFCDPDCTGSNPQYLVTWSGHGDALALWRINSDGTLTLANSYAYTTWGLPTTTTHNGVADLGFRFLYVGRFGVAWDNPFGLGLHHMGARHYSPTLGRFLQPDPSATEQNLYAYANNSPLTRRDPSGLEAYDPNPSEDLACIFHPAQCETWKYASAFAFYYSDRSSEHFRVRNAIRHCVQQCLITYWAGWSWARFWGTIHETGNLEYAATAPERRDRKVDLHNNLMGRFLGLHLGSMIGFKPRLAAELCVQAWNSQFLWHVGEDNRIRWSNGGGIVPNPPYKWDP
jgi:RHS repeat-associated protein